MPFGRYVEVLEQDSMASAKETYQSIAQDGASADAKLLATAIDRNTAALEKFAELFDSCIGQYANVNGRGGGKFIEVYDNSKA